ncbi:unnamed protein product, partial [Hapterophycus canaliculatus]
DALSRTGRTASGKGNSQELHHGWQASRRLHSQPRGSVEGTKRMEIMSVDTDVWVAALVVYAVHESTRKRTHNRMAAAGPDASRRGGPKQVTTGPNDNASGLHVTTEGGDDTLRQGRRGESIADLPQKDSPIEVERPDRGSEQGDTCDLLSDDEEFDLTGIS